LIECCLDFRLLEGALVEQDLLLSGEMAEEVLFINERAARLEIENVLKHPLSRTTGDPELYRLDYKCRDLVSTIRFRGLSDQGEWRQSGHEKRNDGAMENSFLHEGPRGDFTGDLPGRKGFCPRELGNPAAETFCAAKNAGYP
jgi:hypothetical protein